MIQPRWTNENKDADEIIKLLEEARGELFETWERNTVLTVVNFAQEKKEQELKLKEEHIREDGRLQGLFDMQSSATAKVNNVKEIVRNLLAIQGSTKPKGKVNTAVHEGRVSLLKKILSEIESI